MSRECDGTHPCLARSRLRRREDITTTKDERNRFRLHWSGQPVRTHARQNRHQPAEGATRTANPCLPRRG